MLTAPLHERNCKQCGKPFQQLRPMQAVCGPICAGRYVRESKKREKRADRAKREAMKRLPELKQEAQRAFNEFIRLRDRIACHQCISSGRPLDWSSNSVDAGHYRSVGSAPHLRFNEDNCHAQSKHDNQYRAGNISAYRLSLIERIGIEAVERLEADNSSRKWTREELISIAKTYRAKARELKKQLNAA